MRIVIATDSFKDSLSAKGVGEACKAGILSLPGKWEIDVVPMADGGEGTVEALVDATEGKFIKASVHDPLNRTIEARFGILGDGKTAVIEMAAASGIELLKPAERNPWNTTTRGTGELIQAALNANCQRIIIGIGGSATNDAGIGMAMALGAKFIDDSNTEIGFGGGELGKIKKIDLSKLDRRISNTEIIVACDVQNPLTGPEGASYIYGPQKGADAKMVKLLDAYLTDLAKLIKEQLGMSVNDIPGAGAAGGLGAGLMAFTGAELQSGLDIVCKETRLAEYLKNADLVITGEGKIDNQTQYGKTPMGVVREAKKFGKPVVAVAGTLGEGYEELYKLGFDAIFSILDKPMKLEEAIGLTPELLTRTSQAIMRTWKTAQNH